MKTLLDTLSWQVLGDERDRLSRLTLNTLFSQDRGRAQTFSLEACGLFCDYSKNWVDTATMASLMDLARERDLSSAISDLLSGEPINLSEGRPALHTALRLPSTASLLVEGVDLVPEIQQVLSRMGDTVSAIRQGEWVGYTGKAFTDVINIGIGGSDLGPMMVNHALSDEASKSLPVHYVSTMDWSYLRTLCAGLNPETTLVIAVSKSMSTQETLLNFKAIKDWLQSDGASEAQAQAQCIAVTAHTERAQALGFTEATICPIWEWVGGRYSIWSAVGLSVAVSLGMDVFLDLLAGAHAMDRHFESAPFEKNMPVVLGLLGIWYQNFFDAQTAAVIPYSQYLRDFPRYLQQLCMESQGKSVTQAGESVGYSTGAIVWGEAGTNSQHSFHQLLMQGSQVTPIDFILPLSNRDGSRNEELMAHGLAQAQVMMQGFDSDDANRCIAGNVPSTMFLMDQLTPFSLGALIALYEHKVFVQSVIWEINAFDQWGVERGKVGAQQLLTDIQQCRVSSEVDASTQQLLRRVLGEP